MKEEQIKLSKEQKDTLVKQLIGGMKCWCGNSHLEKTELLFGLQAYMHGINKAFFILWLDTGIITLEDRKEIDKRVEEAYDELSKQFKLKSYERQGGSKPKDMGRQI